MGTVVSNILDPIHSTLPVNIWDHVNSPEPKLKAQHAKWIRTTVEHVLADAGYTHMRDWLSLVLTGSLTTFQYDKHSDCDISLFVDAERFPEWSRAEMIGVMVNKLDGTILPGTPYQMQCFVVAGDVTKEDLYQPGLRSGWDIDKHKWIEPPDPTRVHDVEKEMNASYAYALEQADKMERLLRYEPDKAIQFWHQIHRRRRRDHQAGKGDYSDSNIVYKFLANRGLFPLISEVSGEYIAKTAIFGIGQPKQPKQYEDYAYLKLKGDERQEAERQHWESARAKNWDRGYQLGVSPHEHNSELGMRSDEEHRRILERKYIPWNNQNKKYKGQTVWYTPEMDADWHRRFQEDKRQKYLNDSSVTADDYQQWLDWYAQHAPQHFDPASQAANATPWESIQAPNPKGWISKVARPQKQVAKFAYDPINNHLAVGKMANEEGATESHAGIVRQVGMDHTQPLMFGQIGDNGHVEVFARPGITGYGKAPLNPKEIDWRMKQAVKHAIPEAQFAKGLHDDLKSPRWEERWTEPRVQFLHDRPVINATQEQPSEDIDFERF